jgi:hypothetical protein
MIINFLSNYAICFTKARHSGNLCRNDEVVIYMDTLAG